MKGKNRMGGEGGVPPVGGGGVGDGDVLVGVYFEELLHFLELLLECFHRPDVEGEGHFRVLQLPAPGVARGLCGAVCCVVWCGVVEGLAPISQLSTFLWRGGYVVLEVDPHSVSIHNLQLANLVGMNVSSQPQATEATQNDVVRRLKEVAIAQHWAS